MISRRVSITGLPWLETGMAILEERYWYPRDYLVPVFPCGLEDLEEKRPATYDDFVVVTRVVYSRLKECFMKMGDGCPAGAHCCCRSSTNPGRSIRSAIG